MGIKLPKIRLTCDVCRGNVSVTKLTISSIFNATCRDCSKKVPAIPLVRGRSLKRVLKLFFGK